MLKFVVYFRVSGDPNGRYFLRVRATDEGDAVRIVDGHLADAWGFPKDASVEILDVKAL